MSDGAPVWIVRVLTLFPEMFPGPLGASLAGKALEKRIWLLETVDIRAFARDKHRSVDDTPFGGGPGMVMRPDVLDAALLATSGGPDAVGRGRVLCLSPRGRRLDQALVRELAAEPLVTVLCGRYEGIDQRVLEAHQLEEVSLGDFVLSGGEPAALALIDACVRLLPGVMGNRETAAEESFEHGLLEYPHYTRPAVWTDGRGREWAVPEVLVSGHHEKVRVWRQAEAERATRERRPDLWLRVAEARLEQEREREPDWGSRKRRQRYDQD
ncbi:tRNA m(1)G37 methyltransferase [uncultured Gammaproteobacteria bacterium]